MGKVFLIRHALTAFDLVGREGRFCGRSDPPLNSKGIEEAQAVAKLFDGVPIDELYSSPLGRSKETANHISSSIGVGVSVDELLLEIDYGTWEGLTKGEVETEHVEDYKRFCADPESWHPEGGESPSDCARRASEWLENVNCQYAAAVTHKTWTRLLLCAFLDVPLQRYRDVFDIKIGGIVVLVVERKDWRIDAVNYGATRKRIIHHKL